MSRYIHDLIEQGEHQQLDFKFEISDAKKIARTLSAFANTDGGKLLVGVKDNGKIAGIRSEEEYYMIEAAAQMYCKPEIGFEVKKWTILGKTVLEFDILKIEKRPCLARDDGEKWLAYLRVGDQNLLANRVMLKVWQKEKRKKGILLKYSEAEEKLLNYLESNEHITISKYCRIARLKLLQAEEILSNLIVLDVIDIRTSEKGALYSLIPEV
ncbi:MAG TPA: ATP-binding protein [Bacteroides sp.]|nr:ATP-binding protein [Bacteroides sp.]